MRIVAGTGSEMNLLRLAPVNRHFVAPGRLPLREREREWACMVVVLTWPCSTLFMNWAAVVTEFLVLTVWQMMVSMNKVASDKLLISVLIYECISPLSVILDMRTSNWALKAASFSESTKAVARWIFSIKLFSRVVAIGSVQRTAFWSYISVLTMSKWMTRSAFTKRFHSNFSGSPN